EYGYRFIIRNAFFRRVTTKCAASSFACAAAVRKFKSRGSFLKYSTRHGAQSVSNCFFGKSDISASILHDYRNKTRCKLSPHSIDLSRLRFPFKILAQHSTLALNSKSNYNVVMSKRSFSLFVGLLLIGSLVAAGKQKVESSKELKPLQGTWK